MYQLYRNAEMEAAIDKKIDVVNDFGYMHSWVINAFYSPNTNSFVILNGLAQGMIGGSIEEEYGMLGTIVGHEITHAFDANGSYYDANGEYNDWWSFSNRKKFVEKVDRLIEFYNNIHLTNDLTVDGKTINTEATADMGGVKVALALAKKVENFDYDKFFRTLAYLWSSSTMALDAVPGRAKDEHPLNYLRVNVTLGQFDEFNETYDIQPGDGMYIPEEQRVKIW